MANIQIGKYKRPGIFIEEFDQSVITSPSVEGITNLVIGSSKKGPFNTPIRLTNINDLEAIFGSLDRNLERKSSFFHRTISKMLETSPVFAMNLLPTRDDLDTVEYKSISSSVSSLNDIKKEGPYRRLFDTTGFWKRDSESFINLVDNDNNVVNLTNLSDRPISVFAFKSQRSGFDRPLLEWYGSTEKVPPYVNGQDFASDYLVDIIVVGGDWSNYQELSVDPRWGAYFNNQGLRKEQARNFANDRNINLLSFYEGLSLIPYFRNLNGTNIFIENVINRDTDTTGLFCAFNNEAVEEEFYNGKIDILGNTIVGENKDDIEFLSYKESLLETIEIEQKPLDLPGNVFGFVSLDLPGPSSINYDDQTNHAYGTIPSETGNIENLERTAWFLEGALYDITSNVDTLGGATGSTISFDVVKGSNAFAVIEDEKISLSSGSVSITIDGNNYTSDGSYKTPVILNTSGEIEIKENFNTGSNPLINTNDVVLFTLDFTITSNIITIDSVDYVNLNFDGYNDLNSSDYNITVNNGNIKIEFLDTNVNPDITDYLVYRRFKLFNKLSSLVNNINSNNLVLNLGPNNNYEKYSLKDATYDVVSTQSLNKSVTINTDLTNSQLSDVSLGYLVIYHTDNETILGTEKAETKNALATSTIGVVGKDSDLYSRFENGIINTKDYFYENRLYLDSTDNSNNLLNELVTVAFTSGEDATSATSSYAGNDYIIFGTNGTDFNSEVQLASTEKIIVPDSVLNNKTFTIIDNSVNNSDPNTLATELGYTGDFYAYQVNENVIKEDLLNVNLVYKAGDDNKVYLKMYLENNGGMILEFTDEILTSQKTINSNINTSIFIKSAKSNLKQTVEIEMPTGYVREPNKILINGERYTELKVGDFLESNYDESSLEAGELPRKLTRVLSKRRYVGDAELTEITTDASIEVKDFNGDLQTTRHLSIDNYANTYKSISFKGFKVRRESLPDGTENRQNEILNLVAKGTPLFKAITNKEAVNFRYLVDSYGIGLTERSKQQLVDICGERLDCFGFINMPSLRSFKNSSSPSFVNSEGVLQTDFIAKGGDPESNPAFLYSFGDGPGTSATGYFTPYVTVNDNGRVLEMPPASHVATTYMRKHISNITSVTPWTIAAGVTNGRITNISGLEHDFNNEDIENLNQSQINPIVFKRNRGYIIETENTGQTLYNSALSFIHVREVLIELERELSRMLLDYQWKFNTPDIRAEIKLRADVICETYVSKNGLFNFFNKMDDENNTPEIIDNQIGVIDTYIEPIRGMGVIVNNITILRTGAISSGGFINS